MAEVIDIKKCLYNYDYEADVLYINFGENRPARGEMLNNFDVVRVDPITEKIIGITLVFFNKRYHIKPENVYKEILPNLLLPFRKVEFVY